MKKILAMSLLAVLLLVGCGEATKKEFKLEEIEIGQIFNGMKIEVIEPFSEYRMVPPIKDFPIGEENVTVEFSGKVSVEGIYEYHSTGILSGQICFTDLSDALPVFSRSSSSSFCFSNTDFAKNYFSPEGSKGEATVIIDNFALNYYPSEVWNTAELVDVIR